MCGLCSFFFKKNWYHPCGPFQASILGFQVMCVGKYKFPDMQCPYETKLAFCVCQAE